MRTTHPWKHHNTVPRTRLAKDYENLSAVARVLRKEHKTSSGRPIMFQELLLLLALVLSSLSLLLLLQRAAGLFLAAAFRVGRRTSMCS